LIVFKGEKLSAAIACCKPRTKLLSLPLYDRLIVTSISIFQICCYDCCSTLLRCCQNHGIFCSHCCRLIVAIKRKLTSPSPWLASQATAAAPPLPLRCDSVLIVMYLRHWLIVFLFCFSLPIDSCHRFRRSIAAVDFGKHHNCRRQCIAATFLVADTGGS